MIAKVSIIWVYYVLNFSNLRRNRKYAIVCLLIVLALFAHSTSYFVIPLLTILYFIKNKLSKNILIIMMIIRASLIIGPYVQNFLRPIFVGFLLSLGSSDAIARSTRYFVENIYDIQVANFNALLPFTAVGITILSFYTKEELNKFGAKCIAFAVIAYNLFNSVSLLNRSLMLFIIFGCILGLPQKIQKPSKQVKLAFSFVALMLFYTIFNAYSQPYNPNSDEGNRLFPYPYVWENKVL